MIGKLIALSKNGEEKGSLPVVNLHFFIGSDLFCDLRINHKDIAAQHCLITSQKNKPALIRNLSRTVPTLVNNTEIGSSDVELKDNDIISIRHKNYKWCYDSSPTPSTSSHTSFVVSSRNRKSWPLFKNKLVAVVTPQRRDENEPLPRKRRGTIAEENISKSKPTPKVLAIKSGLRATSKQKFGKRKSSVKISQNIVPIERTPKVLPSLARKSVKFLDVSGPRSRLGRRGRNSSNATPYKCTPAKPKVSTYATPPSSFGKKPIKSILKTPSSSSTTPRKDDLNEQSLLTTSDILATPLPNIPEIILHSPSPVGNELLKTPEKGEQPEIVMRSSRRKAAIIRSPPSTPKSITKKRKSPEEKSIEASERAAKKLKQCPPYAIDKKKRAALLQCHRKSLTPHPVARRSGKLITNFPSSFSRRFEINSPVKSKFSPKCNSPSVSENLKLPTDSLTPTVFKYTDSEINLPKTTASLGKLKPVSRKKSNKSFSKETSSIFRKFTRASTAARISNSLPQKAEATDVLSALDLSRRWPSPLQGELSGNSSTKDVSNLSGFKKLFSADKTLDVRELFLEKNSVSDTVTEKSFQSLPETVSRRVSRQSIISKGKQSTDMDEFMHSFQSEGAQDQPCSTSLLSGSLSSFPSYSSTSRRSLSLKHGRKSTLSPKDINSSNVEHQTEEKRSSENITTQSSGIKIVSPSVSRKGRRSLNILNGSSLENNQLMESTNPSNTNETKKNSVDKINVSSSLNDMPSKNFDGCNVNTKGLNDSSLDISAFSLGSFDSSYHRSRSGDSFSLSPTSDVNVVDEETYLEDSMESGIAKDVRVKTPLTGKVHSKGRISLRRAVLLASTPKPGKVLTNNESHLPLEIEVDTKQNINKSGSYKLRMNRSRNTSAEVASVKLRKVMHKGKGFIAKTTSRFPSLPLTTDSTILKDLSPISTSVGDLRTSKHNKVNWNRSLKTSKNLINNNKNSPVAASGSIQSTNISGSVSTDHSHVEDISELAFTLSSSVNISIRKRGRPSKRNAELSQLEVSTNGEKSLQSVQLVVSEKNAFKQNSSILEHSGSSRQSNKTAHDSKLYVETQKDISTLSLLNKSPINANNESSNTSVGRRGRPPNLSLSSESPQLEKSTVVKKRSRSLPSSSVDQVTPKQDPTILKDLSRTRRSSRRDTSKVIKDMNTDKSSSSPPTTSGKENSASPISKASINTSVGRKGRPSKLSASLDLQRSNDLEKYSGSLRSSFNVQVTPVQDLSTLEDFSYARGSIRKGQNSKLLGKTHIDSSFLSPPTLADETGFGKEDAATPVTGSFNTSVGKRSRPSKLSSSPSSSQLVRSTVIKRHSQSLPSFSDDVHLTPKQESNIIKDSTHPRRSSRTEGDKTLRKTVKDSSSLTPSILHVTTASTRGSSRVGHASKTIRDTSTSIDRTCSVAEVYATPNMSTSSSVEAKRSLPSLTTSKRASAILQDSRQIPKKEDNGKMLNKTDTQKSKKRKVKEISPESDLTNLLFHGSIDNSISSQAKKKVKISSFGHSETFSAFSSTPIATKNPYLGSRCEKKHISRLKFRSTQSSMGLSPIIGSSFLSFSLNDSSMNDKSSQVGMICLRHSECPSGIVEGNKSDSLVISSSKNKSVEVSRSHNSIDLDMTDSSNYGANNSKVKLGGKRSTRISTSQNELPFINQTPVTSEHPSEKEGKSLQLPSKARMSGTNSLQDSKKEEMINITSSLRSKTPVIKLTSSKNKTSSRKIKKKGKKSIVERKAVPENHLSKREVENTEATSLRNVLSSDLKRPSTNDKNVGKSILSSPKTSERDDLTVISPVPKRRGRPPKVKEISKNKKSANKISPVSQRRGRSAKKNTNLTPLVKSAEASPQKMPKKEKGKKTVVAEDPSTSSRGNEIRNLKSVTDQISDDVEQNSSISFPKTRSKVAVLALKTSKKSILITSPIVKSPSLNRGRVEKVKSESIQSPHAKKQGQSAKEDSVNVASSSPVKRRGRSAINNSSSKREKPVTTSPHLPKRGRLNKVQDSANEVIKEAITPPLKKRGRPAGKNNSSTKRGNSKYDLSNNNETLASPSLPKRRGRSAKVQESNISVSGKKKDRKISESGEDTTSRRGRSVVKNADSNKKAEKGPMNNHETIASPSLPKKGRPTKVQNSNLSVSGKGKDRNISESVESTKTTLRRGRLVVENSDSSHHKKVKSEKDPADNHEKIASPSLPKRGKTVQKTTGSRKNTKKKNSEIEEVQTNMRRGRSAMKDQLSSPDKKKRIITQESTEDDANFSVDSSSPKRGRSAKRVNRNTSEKPTVDQSTLPLQKRGRSAVKSSDSSPVKRGKSKKDPTDTNVAVSSPPVPKRGRSAKIQDVTVSKKDASNKDLESIFDQNLSSKQKRGRSRAVAVGENSLDVKGKAKQEIEKNSVNQIPSSSSSKNERPVVSENISPRKSRSVAIKVKTSPVLLKKKQATDKTFKLPGRRGKLASSPQPEIRKVSERSKAIKKNSKSKDIGPLKSAIKKRLSKKSSLMGTGLINHGRRKVHFNKYVARNSNSKKK